MCACVKPTLNGEPGYSWDGKSTTIRQPDAPVMAEGDQLLRDEPGRCGRGCDSHAYHFRLVKEMGGTYSILVRHGGGDERVRLGGRSAAKQFAAMDSDDCYWMMQMIYHVQKAVATHAREQERATWFRAAAEKRIKTRKCKDRVKVWIEGTPLEV